MDDLAVSTSLRKWFVVHCVVDVLVAVPLLLAPRVFLGLLGWSEVDPVMSRAVAAALFGIGIESWLCRNEGRRVFQAMLNLKLIWSGFVMVGIITSLIQGGPQFAWVFLAIFAAFAALWWRHWLVLRR